MNKVELLKVYTVAKTLWRNFKLPETDFEANMHDEVWFEMLKNYPYKIIETAMVEYSKKSEFCNIGKIVEECQKIIEAQNGLKGILTEEKIFNEIMRAIKRGYTTEEMLKLNEVQGLNDSYIIRFESLSEIAKRVVVNWQGFKELCFSDTETFNTVTKSHIIRVARVLIEKQKYVKIYENLSETLTYDDKKLIENN